MRAPRAKPEPVPAEPVPIEGGLEAVLRELAEIRRRLPRTGAGFDAWGGTVAFGKRHAALHRARRKRFVEGS